MKKNAYKIIFFGLIFYLLAICLDTVLTGLLYKKVTGEIGIWNQIRSGTISADLLVSGDSRALTSVECHTMKRHAHMECMNIAMNGNLFDLQYARFKMYLKYNKSPKILVQVLGISTLRHSDPLSPLQFLPYLQEPEIYDALMLTKSRDIFIKAKYIPLYGIAYLRTVRSLDVIDDLTSVDNADIRFNGFHPEFSRWNLSKEKLQDLYKEGIEWVIEEKQAAQLTEMADICKKNNIRFVLVLAPMYVEGRDLVIDKERMLARYQALADRLGVLYLNYFDHPMSLNRDYFYNFQHTNIHGAKVLSEALAKDIQSHLKL